MGVTALADKSGALLCNYCTGRGDNSGAAVQPGFAGILSGLGRGRGWPMQCSQLHQIAVNYGRVHCNVQRSVNLITPWRSPVQC